MHSVHNAPKMNTLCYLMCKHSSVLLLCCMLIEAFYTPKLFLKLVLYLGDKFWC